VKILWQHVQAGSISDHLGVTQCTPTGNDAPNWHHRLSLRRNGGSNSFFDVMFGNYPKVTIEDTTKDGDVA
jgi:hypothetical protein